MPWSRTSPAKERIKFVLEWEARWTGKGRVNLSALCREFGISRETAYVWLRRDASSGATARACGGCHDGHVIRPPARR
jgi:hypothetical protein